MLKNEQTNKQDKTGLKQMNLSESVNALQTKIAMTKTKNISLTNIKIQTQDFKTTKKLNCNYNAPYKNEN